MKFPGKRKSKHYFPVHEKDPLLLHPASVQSKTHVIGIDQTMVDIEARVNKSFLEKYGLLKGHSLVINQDIAEKLHEELISNNMINSEFAGGTIGNTLHNYSLLADNRSILLGIMSKNIEIRSYSYKYLCNTSSRVDLNYLQGVDGPIGRCFALITKDGERTFAINEGCMNQLKPENIPETIFKNASALVITSYLLRGQKDDPLPQATLKAIEFAKDNKIPVVLTLGTRFVIEDNPVWWQNFIKEHISVIAMNEEEAEALTGIKDPLLASDKSLDWADLVLCTSGPAGLYLAGYTEKKARRKTHLPLLPGAIPEFNRFEFSRPMRKSETKTPVKIYSHIAPYMGGPETIKNTNGAGDGALSALLHDMSANSYHKDLVPNSTKHKYKFLTYSSFSQICKYANRVSYEVLAQHSPRLNRGLPEKEDSLEESYWER
ncbi:MAG: inosine/guanosine kinase [Deltaproteobacteria bacterium]|jgi:inosine kinase|nr:inosine/guanosine kinase [Deltaproteobacteria bacterium]